MTKRLLAVLALALLLAGCTDPKRQEEANAIRRDSQVKATATMQAVSSEATVTVVAVRATATRIAEQEQLRRDTYPETVKARKRALNWAGVGAVVFVISATIAWVIVSLGGSVALTRKANLESRVLRIDRTTRTFPILVDLRNGWVVDLETGERFKTGDRSQPHPGKLAISGQARVTGLLAQSAEKIAKSAKSPQPGDMLPAIGQSVPLLDWLPELKEPK